MPHSLVRFRLVKPSPRQQPTSMIQRSSERSLQQRLNCSLSLQNSNSETLGNKLQRLMILSPKSAITVELLVDQLLKSVAHSSRGLAVAAALCFLQ